jgi:hypothetical protein
MLSLVIAVLMFYFFIGRTLSLKLWFYSYWPFQAVSFYLVQMYQKGISVTAISSLVFEFCLLLISVYIFKKIKEIVDADLEISFLNSVKKILNFIIVFNICIIIVRVSADVGISRISAVYNNPLIKYIFYTGHLSMFVGAICSAALLNNGFKLHFWLFVLIAFLLMFFSDSKGSAIIYLFQIYALSNLRLGWRLISGSGSLVVLMFFYLKQLSVKLAVDFDFMLRLIFVRFGLHNDTRALVMITPNEDRSLSTFFGESFRGLANIFGSEYKYPPIGSLLYQNEFGTDEVGGNAAFTGLVNFFYYNGFSMIIFIPTILLIALITILLCNVRLKNELILLILLSVLSFMVLIFAQDFLALIPLTVGAVIFIPFVIFFSKIKV